VLRPKISEESRATPGKRKKDYASLRMWKSSRRTEEIAGEGRFGRCANLRNVGTRGGGIVTRVRGMRFRRKRERGGGLGGREWRGDESTGGASARRESGEA